MTPKKPQPKHVSAAKPRASCASTKGDSSGDAPGNPLWRAEFDCTDEAILLSEADFQVSNANSAAVKLLGKPVARVIGRNCPALFKGTELEPAGSLLERARETRASQQMELKLNHSGAWLLLKADPILDASGKLCGLVNRFLDITAVKKTETDLRDSEQRYRLLFELAADPMMLVDAETGVVVEFNQMTHELLGYTREGFASRKISDLEVPPSPDEAEHVKQRLLAEGISSHDTRYRAADGSLRDVRVGSRSVTMGDRRFIHSIWRDVTEQKRAEESMQALSLVDDLTGLYNRRGFQTLAEQQFRIAARMRKKMYLLFVDVDGMKRVNDTMGHREGNQLLVEAASALRQAFRNSDITARIGGDEFVVLVLEAERLWPAMLRGRLDSKVAAKNAGGRNPALSLSVGVVAFNPEEPAALEDLLHQADLAMYEEKRVKRGETKR